MSQKINLQDEQISKGIHALLHNCAGISANDRVYIITNADTSGLGDLMKDEALKTSSFVEHQVIEIFKIHGQEPSDDVARKMFGATVIFCLTKMSMAHTQARLKANNNGVKFFSLPDYSADVMRSKALLANFKRIKNASEAIADLLTSASEVRVISSKGTDITMNIEGRTANPAPGFCYDNILLASPPDAETNIAPNEFLTNGVAVVDGSIPCLELGLLTSPIRLEIEKGFVKNISGEKSDILNRLFDSQKNSKCRIIAEFGIGLNKLAELKGSMLEDEGSLGTIHLGIGSNKTIGGLNEVAFHLDHVIREPTVYIDGNLIMEDGVFINRLANLLIG